MSIPKSADRRKGEAIARLSQQVEELQARLAASEERARKAEEMSTAFLCRLAVYEDGDIEADEIISLVMAEWERAWKPMPEFLSAVRRHLDQSESDTETPDQDKKGTGHGSV